MKKLFVLIVCALVWSGKGYAETELPALGDSTSGLISLQQEQALGSLWLRQLRANQATLEDPLVITWFTDTIYQLVPFSDLAVTDLQLVVVDSPQLNAFAVPGGIIGINYGLFLFTDDEDELASVLAHELVHLSQRHFARQVEAAQRRNPIALATLLASILLIATDNPDAGFAGLVSSQAASIQSQLAFSRDFEREADRLGMNILVQSGLDAHAMPDMFSSMSEANRYSSSALEFLMTHPLTPSRVADAGNRAAQYPTRPRTRTFEFLTLRLSAERRYQLKEHAAKTFSERLETASGTERDALLYQLADLALINEQPRRGLSHLNEMSAEHRQHPATEALQARLFHADQRTPEGIALLKQQLLIHPQDLSLRVALSRLLMEDNRAAEAVPVLKDLAEDYQRMPFSWSLLSEAANASGDAVLAYRALGESYFHSGRRQDAVQQFRSAIREAGKIKDFQRESAIRERLREIEGTNERLPG